MKTWIKQEVFDFVDYVRGVKNFSETTEKTYVINLLEAIEFVRMQKDEEIILFDLKPYRVHIKDKAKKTIYKKISIFRSFVKYLKKKYKIKIKNDENISTSKTLPKPLPNTYIKEALEVAELKDKLMIELIYTLGLRISEVANLKLKDIKNDWVIIKGKGGKIRQLPLMDGTKKLLSEYLKKESPLIFLYEKNGEKEGEYRLRYRFSKVFKDLGLKVTPHQLRHSFATELLNEGAKISDVSRLLGHSSLESTQIYTKLSSIKKKESYEKSHPLAKMGDELV